MMHSSKGGKWRKSTGAMRMNYDRAGINVRGKIIIALWQKN
jgi:hypothetical protein